MPEKKKNIISILVLFAQSKSLPLWQCDCAVGLYSTIKWNWFRLFGYFFSHISTHFMQRLVTCEGEGVQRREFKWTICQNYSLWDENDKQMQSCSSRRDIREARLTSQSQLPVLGVFRKTWQACCRLRTEELKIRHSPGEWFWKKGHEVN